MSVEKTTGIDESVFHSSTISQMDRDRKNVWGVKTRSGANNGNSKQKKRSLLFTKFTRRHPRLSTPHLSSQKLEKGETFFDGGQIDRIIVFFVFFLLFFLLFFPFL